MFAFRLYGRGAVPTLATTVMLPLGLLQNVAAGIAVAVGPGLFSTTTELTLMHPVASLMVSV